MTHTQFSPAAKTGHKHWEPGPSRSHTFSFRQDRDSPLPGSDLELFFQLLSKRAQLLQALAQVHMPVEFNEGLDEVRNTPFGFHLIPAATEGKHP